MSDRMEGESTWGYLLRNGSKGGFVIGMLATIWYACKSLLTWGDDGALGSGLISTITGIAATVVGIGLGLSQVENVANWWDEKAWPAITGTLASWFGGGETSYDERPSSPGWRRTYPNERRRPHYSDDDYFGRMSDSSRQEAQLIPTDMTHVTTPCVPDVREQQQRAV